MAAQVGVLIIHGMGSQKEDFAAGMVRRLEQQIVRAGLDPARVAFRPIWWAKILIDKQTDLLASMTSQNRLDWMWLRRFIVQSLADAVAYQKTFRMPDVDEEQPVYHAVHAAIAMEVAALADEVVPTAPLVVIAHSLGCHMMSNYIWDTQTGQNGHVIDPSRSFERLETLTAIATFGSNLPLFLLSNERLEPIVFPGAAVPTSFPGRSAQQIAEVTTWTNFYDRDDVLAWPLRPLPNYATTVTADIQVNAGGLLSWTPFSHNSYWEDRDVIRPIGQNLVKILKLL